MVGGYVLVALPAALSDPDFVSGTAIPGIYETVSLAFSTGKFPVCQLGGPAKGVLSFATFAPSIVKASDGSFLIMINNKSRVVKPDDTVVID